MNRHLPLVVAAIGPAQHRKQLRSLAAEIRWIASAARLLNSEYPRPPNLFVLQAAGSDSESAAEQVAQLQQNRPLTDIVVWAPRATGSAVRCLYRAGASDVVASESPKVLSEAVAEVLRNQHLLGRVNELDRRPGKISRYESMLSRSDSMWDLFHLCSRVAATPATVLIVGETGTGKELLARAIHRRSQRSGRFVAANCASVPRELINSELFGHEKGAFTGANRAKRGLVQHAHQGTLFLDEIGDMPPEGQQSLLRMLQERQIRPVGSLVEHDVDVRVVAATNVPLDQAVRSGEFREDLFYRLDVIRMNVPPLRRRPEDILFLFGHFTKRLTKHYSVPMPTFSDEFLDTLMQYEWPGNVRQLENLCERLVLARPHQPLTDRDFNRLRSTSLSAGADSLAAEAGRAAPVLVDPEKSLQENVQPVVDALEREYLQAVLKQNAGRIQPSAVQAGINRRTLLRKLKAHGIDKQSFKE